MAVPSASDRAPRWLLPVSLAIGAVALLLPGLVVAFPPKIVSLYQPRAAPVRVVPAAELPPVEPVAFQDLSPDEARAWNASVPFVTGPNPAARPFRLGGGDEDRARAVDCMAAAMLYEAGDDPVGERAVGQVVINRVRHPAFPKSICAVVFQGSERTTGCQFTFTCDGALDRPPNPDAWGRAQRLATAALTGTVYRPVGYATHYHTDWVVPYWSASLDKLAEVHTHLFFRWTGWWGTPPAFRRPVSDVEPPIAKLAAYSDAHNLAVALDAAATVTAAAEPLLGMDPAAPASDPNTFLVTLDRRLTADQLPAFAKTACGARDYCKLLAWTDRKLTPAALPLEPVQVAAMAFSYLRDTAHGFEKPLWNCAAFKRTNPRDCMKSQVALLPFPPAPAPSPTGTPATTSAAGAAPASWMPIDLSARLPAAPIRPTPRATPSRTPTPARP